jgi:hypothetical protein
MGIPLKSPTQTYRDGPNVEVTEVTKRPIRQAEIDLRAPKFKRAKRELRQKGSYDEPA